MMPGRDKLGLLMEAAEKYVPDQQIPDYNETLKNKIISLIHSQYPWLGDFRISLVENDKDNDFAYGAGQLKGYSSGFRVEFPVFYLDGVLLDIPTFVLPERKLTLPFNETMHKLITATLNSSEDMGMIRERSDVSDSLLRTLSDTDQKRVSDVMKLSSFARILSFLPRRTVRSYAKTASVKFPELTRDFYAALSMSKTRSRIKDASAFRAAADKKASMDNLRAADDHPSSFISIATPVFLSEAEAKEREYGVATEVVQVADNAFVLPEANNKINLTRIPSFEDITKSLCQDFEYMSPGELSSSIKDHIARRPQEGVVFVSPSTMKDYWCISSSMVGTPSEYDSDPEHNMSPDYRTRALSVNNFGGEFLYDNKMADLDEDVKDSFRRKKISMDQSRVVYFPKSMEKVRYLRDILSSRFNLKHNIMEATRDMGSYGYYPVLTGRGRLLALDLKSSRSSVLDGRVERRMVNGKLAVNYYSPDNDEKSQTVDTPEGKKQLPAIKIVADPVTEDIERIFYLRSYVPDGLLSSWRITEGGDYFIIDFTDVYTFDPAAYTLLPGGAGEDFILKPVLTGTTADSSDRRDILVAVYRPSSSGSWLSRLLVKVFDPAELDNSFVLNDLKSACPDILSANFPFITVNLLPDEEVRMDIRSGTSDGAVVKSFSYRGTDDAVTALAHIGIVPEDLISLRDELNSSRRSGNDVNVATKMAYSLLPASENAEEDSDNILQQALVLMQNIQENQDKMLKDADMRDRLLETQLKLIDAKLGDIDELKQTLATAVNPDQGAMPPEQEAQGGEMPQQGGQPEGLPPEVLEAMASAVRDPGTAEQHDLTPEEVQLLHAAAQGDQKAAGEIGFSPSDHQTFMNLLSETEALDGAEGQEQPAEGQEGGNVEILAQILQDPEGAVNTGGMDQAMVEALLKAAEGDAAAAEQIGVTLEEVQQAAQMAQSAGQPQEQEGEEQLPEEEQLRQNFEKAINQVTAYFEPDRLEELNVTPEELGMVTIILRSPSKAVGYGIPGEQVQAVTDAYTTVTGRNAFQGAEREFTNAPDAPASQTGNMDAAKNVISMSKGFEEYSKPVAQTSALLDMLPKIKTAKLFFKNADAFRDMLTILGEILINVQLNAVTYKDSLGVDSYNNLLAKFKKLYDDFGTVIVDMYSLNNNSK